MPLSSQSALSRRPPCNAPTGSVRSSVSDWVEGLDQRNSFVYGGRRDLPRALARALPALDLHAEHLRGVAPEYRELVIIAEAGRRHDVIDRMVLPRIV